MKPSILAAIAGVLLTSLSASAGPGGSGGSGVRGGSGVFCEGKSPRVLESYLAELKVPGFVTTLAKFENECRETKIPAECFTDRLLLPLESEFPLLVSLIRQRLREHGPAHGWKRTFAFLGLPQLDLENLHDPLAVAIRNHHRVRYGSPANALGVRTDQLHPYDYGPDTVFDDAPDFDLPADCVTIQLAVVRPGARLPELTLEGDHLTTRTMESRALELHEAIYAVASDLGMDNPLLTRALGVALLTGSESVVAARNFSEYPDRAREFRSRGETYSRIADGGLRLTASGGTSKSCSTLAVVRFDGVQSILIHELHFEGTSLVLKNRRLPSLAPLRNCGYQAIRR